jgi:hypothetical protein
MVAAAVLLGAACGGSGSSAPDREATAAFPVYDWRPSGAIDPGPGPTGACRVVLLVGDSLAGEIAPFVQATYVRSGYCALVLDEAVPGSAPAGYHPTGTWTTAFRNLLGLHQPDLVVSFFSGNGGPTLQHENFDESLAIIDAAEAEDVPIYWVLPPLSSFPCDWDSSIERNGHRTYRRWVLTNIPGRVPTVDGNVLTPRATPTSGREGYNDTLRVDGEERVLRDPDCIHLTDAGAELIAHEVVRSTSGAWTARG